VTGNFFIDSPYYDHSIEPYPFDIDKAKALLAEAGWRDTDGDSTREAHDIPGFFDGTPFHINYATTTSAAREVVSAAIVEDLAACGIQVDVEQLDAEAFYAEGGGTPVYGRHFDLLQFAWLTDVVPPCDLYLSTEISSDANQWSGQNFSGYTDPAYDAACGQALSVLPGEPDFAAAHGLAQQHFSEALPALPLYYKVWAFATRPDLEGFIPDAIAVETWNIEAFALE